MSEIIANKGSISGEVSSIGEVSGGTVTKGKSLSAGEVARNTSSNHDYNTLINHPLMNGEEIIGEKTSEDYKIVICKTTSEWSELTDIVSVKGAIYVYTDYKPIGTSGDYQPGIKVGDGLAYVVDLPFVTAEDARITAEDIANWNNKVAVMADGENLIFY